MSMGFVLVLYQEWRSGDEKCSVVIRSSWKEREGRCQETDHPFQVSPPFSKSSSHRPTPPRRCFGRIHLDSLYLWTNPRQVQVLPRHDGWVRALPRGVLPFCPSTIWRHRARCGEHEGRLTMPSMTSPAKALVFVAGGQRRERGNGTGRDRKGFFDSHPVVILEGL